MERVINTELGSFLCIDRITEITEKSIKGEYFAKDLKFTLLESMAQICALHVRYITCFKKFAFLLKVVEAEFPELKETEFSISAELKAKSAKAYSYKVTAKTGEKKFRSELIISAIDFDDEKREKEYSSHYRKVFECLKKEL